MTEASPVVDIGLTDKQLDSVRTSTAAYNIWEGAVSSGKTVGSLYRWIMFILNTLDLGGEMVMTGRTRDSVWRNNILPMMDSYPGVVIGNLGAPTCRIAGRVVHVVGASDIKAEAVIRGMTILGAYVDEVTTLPKEYFQMLLSRLRVTGRKGGLASKLFGTTNPDGPKHWFKVDYLDNPRAKKEWERFHFTIKDNPRLAKEYVEKLDSQYTGVWHDRFIKGLWVAAEGAIWGMFDEGRHVIEEDLMPPMERLMCLGIDYGTEHRTAGILIGYAKKRLWAVDEWAPPKGLAPSQYSASFRHWLESRDHAPEWVRVDPAARDFREQLYYDGVGNVAKAFNAVVPGIRIVSSLLATDRLMVSERCKELITEIPGYVWDQKATDRGDEAPVKENDDFCDALRYAVQSSQGDWRALLPVHTMVGDKEQHLPRTLEYTEAWRA